MSIIDQNIDKIRKLCEQHYVSQLSVFGSILTDEFGKNSDIELLVDFSNMNLQLNKHKGGNAARTIAAKPLCSI